MPRPAFLFACALAVLCDPVAAGVGRKYSPGVGLYGGRGMIDVMGTLIDMRNPFLPVNVSRLVDCGGADQKVEVVHSCVAVCSNGRVFDTCAHNNFDDTPWKGSEAPELASSIEASTEEEEDNRIVYLDAPRNAFFITAVTLHDVSAVKVKTVYPEPESTGGEAFMIRRLETKQVPNLPPGIEVTASSGDCLYVWTNGAIRRYAYSDIDSGKYAEVDLDIPHDNMVALAPFGDNCPDDVYFTFIGDDTDHPELFTGSVDIAEQDRGPPFALFLLREEDIGGLLPGNRGGLEKPVARMQIYQNVDNIGGVGRVFFLMTPEGVSYTQEGAEPQRVSSILPQRMDLLQEPEQVAYFMRRDGGFTAIRLSLAPFDGGIYYPMQYPPMFELENDLVYTPGRAGHDPLLMYAESDRAVVLNLNDSMQAFPEVSLAPPPGTELLWVEAVRREGAYPGDTLVIAYAPVDLEDGGTRAKGVLKLVVDVDNHMAPESIKNSTHTADVAALTRPNCTGRAVSFTPNQDTLLVACFNKDAADESPITFVKVATVTAEFKVDESEPFYPGSDDDEGPALEDFRDRGVFVTDRHVADPNSEMHLILYTAEAILTVSVTDYISEEDHPEVVGVTTVDTDELRSRIEEAYSREDFSKEDVIVKSVALRSTYYPKSDHSVDSYGRTTDVDNFVIHQFDVDAETRDERRIDREIVIVYNRTGSSDEFVTSFMFVGSYPYTMKLYRYAVQDEDSPSAAPTTRFCLAAPTAGGIVEYILLEDSPAEDGVRFPHPPVPTGRGLKLQETYNNVRARWGSLRDFRVQPRCTVTACPDGNVGHVFFLSFLTGVEYVGEVIGEEGLPGTAVPQRPPALPTPVPPKGTQTPEAEGGTPSRAPACGCGCRGGRGEPFHWHVHHSGDDGCRCAGGCLCGHACVPQEEVQA